ncbi:Putative isochorismate synthase MenF [Acidipropionibacterium virtanenii]|uniref:Isochorismate synthase MenF n=2 Tax=Acidipropionibacterium virtanenii TaxID=2057246 RepID=A0A344US22_9ACTN|nr:Putative isochorismate synthase MenF [Acidipropionibacterium virtanenii]
MIINPGSSRLRARTVAVRDPGPLEAYLTPTRSMCLVHSGEGVVGLGEVARFETDSPDAADVWWETFSAEIEDETEMPGLHGTGPIAFGSFAFDPDRSASPSVMIVPETVIGHRAGYSWVTQMSYDSVDADPPRIQAPPRPSEITSVADGVIGVQRWRELATQVQEILGEGDLERVLLMRDTMVRTATPIDPRWLVETLIRREPDAWTYLVEGAIGVTTKLMVGDLDGLLRTRALTHGPTGNHSTEGRILDALRGRGPIAAEHRRTVEWSAERIAPFCSAVRHSPFPGLVWAAEEQLLSTDVTGAALPGTRSLAVVGGLHPAPFVSGLPPWKAADTLAEVEEVDRGRITGPLGWVDRDGDGEWVTDWRGAQIDGTDPNLAHVFTGQAVSRDDDVDALSAELEAKLRATLSVVGL